MTLLSREEVSSQLREMEGWSGDTSAISKSYEFDAFMDGVAFVNRVAEIAEGLDHHPDIDIRWTKVKVTLSTHSEGGVTGKDIELARAIEAASTAETGT